MGLRGNQAMFFLGFLDYRNEKTGKWCPKIQTMVEDMGFSKKTIIDYLKVFEKKGLIVKRKEWKKLHYDLGICLKSILSGLPMCTPDSGVAYTTPDQVYLCLHLQGVPICTPDNRRSRKINIEGIEFQKMTEEEKQRFSEGCQSVIRKLNKKEKP
jgi:hypothetical protein